MKQRFDLTTQAGLNAAMRVLEGRPDLAMLEYGYRLVKDFFSSNDAEKQAEAARVLIEEGKKQGVDEMEIVLNNTKGFKLNIPLEGGKIDTLLGNDGKIHLKVKFINDRMMSPLLGTGAKSSKASFFQNKTLSVVLIVMLIILCILAGYLIAKL